MYVDDTLFSAMVLNMNSNSSSASQPHHDDIHKSFGILLVASASMLSGLSAALTQRAMTDSKGQQRHVMLLSAEMAVYGIVFLLVNLVINSDVQLGGGLLSNWSVYTFIPVLTNVNNNKLVTIAFEPLE
jgi:cytochrome b561